MTAGRSESSGSVSSGCGACGLGCSGQIPKQGRGLKGVLVVLEHPSANAFDDEDHYTGQSGDLVYRALEDAGLHPLRDCIITSAVLCPSKQEPTMSQALHCRTFLEELIKEHRPKVVITLGVLAVHALTAHRLEGRVANTQPSDFFGETIPIHEDGYWLCPTFSPKRALEKRAADIRLLLQQHIKHAATLLETPLESAFVPTANNVHTTTDPKQAIEWIEAAVASADWVAFDYETTGIKPHRHGHSIVTASLAWRHKDGILRGYAFRFDLADEELTTAWRRLMLSRKASKIAHNAGFEMVWTFVRGGGYWPQGLGWDTCLGAHCLHNQKPTGLKFEVFTKFGVAGYDSSVDAFLKSTPAERKFGSNAFNRILEAPLQDVLYYNALDSIYTLALYELQAARFAKLPTKLYEGFLLLLDGQYELTLAHQSGLNIDIERLPHLRKEVLGKLSAAQLALMEFPEYRTFQEATGKAFNPESSDHLRTLFTKLLGVRGKDEDLDEAGLQEINTEFARTIVQCKKLAKIISFVDGYEREAVDGVIHPFFNLHKVITFRSSSESPNFQNIPKRDKQAKKIIRSLFKPAKGCRIVEYDYKAVEVCVSACYHHDKNMIRYIEEPGTDMHRDTAMDLFFRTKDDFLKDERQAAKNGFVFPAFYGSMAVNMAKGIWDQLGPETFKHLASKGLRTFDKFKSHVIHTEKIFWEERFYGYHKWREDMFKQCQRVGYYDTHTGFRVHAPMRFTEATNAPIQGSAFHCLLWDLVQIAPRLRSMSGRSYFLGQIHDALIANVHPEEEEEMDRLMKEYGTKRIREYWPWIIVPLTIEKERTAVDGTWAETEECGSL